MVDATKDTLSSYAYELSFSDLDDKTIHQVKRTLLDSIGDQGVAALIIIFAVIFTYRKLLK